MLFKSFSDLPNVFHDTHCLDNGHDSDYYLLNPSYFRLSLQLCDNLSESHTERLGCVVQSASSSFFFFYTALSDKVKMYNWEMAL